MSPAALDHTRKSEDSWDHEDVATNSALLSGDLNCPPPIAFKQKGNWQWCRDGTKFFDASGGPAVASLGYGELRMIKVLCEQIQSGTIVNNDISFRSEHSERLARKLVESTGGHMGRAYFIGSGSDANEAAIKLVAQYHMVRGEPQRTHHITRNQSYHGATIGALNLSGFPTRRSNYEGILRMNVSHVSPVDPYRGRGQNESNAEYVKRLAEELDAEFKRVGPKKVAAFWAEPVVGAALGAMEAAPGYFKAMQAVCQKHGALFVADEVMCGSGRMGTTLHAWQQEEDFYPDIQTLGKGLTGGYQPVGAVLASLHVSEVIQCGSGEFAHGQTFQGFSTMCVAALEVLKIIAEDNLLENVAAMGERLALGLKQGLESHPHVGFISGKGFLRGVHFVKDKKTLEPFDRKLLIAERLHAKALEQYEMYFYKGAGSYDGQRGDHIIISPSYKLTETEVDHIVNTTVKVIHDFFDEIKGEISASPPRL